LTEIEDLGLWETKVESIAPLAGLTKLRILGIYPEYDTKMGDDGVAVIENFVHLEELFLNDEAITGATIKRLSPLTKLRTLNVSFDRVESEDSFAALDGLTQLESLSLHGAGIGDAALAHLAGMQKLESLNLLVDHGSGDGFRHLAGLPQLKYLYLTGEGANDTAIAQLAGLAELRTIQAQDGFITKAAAERLAAQLPRVTIILDKDVVKSPRKSYPFERRKFSDTVSLLVPSDWHSEGNAQEYIALREDGWERVGGWSGEFVGPAELRMHRSDDSSSAQEAMLAAVNNNAHLDPKVLEQDVQAMSGSDDTASCTYQNRFALHLVSAAKTDAGHIVLTGQAPPSRFADFEALFKSVARSVRIGNDPALHAEQTLDIPAEELQADRERP
jgi:hypothetical protein